MTDRLYYDDSTLRSFTAEVTDVRERVRENGQSLWEISLDRSAFYPTSGGQPFDTGILRAVSRNGAALDAAILEVAEDEAGEVWHCTAKPLNAGTKITGEIDWPRRRDHMQQHTGQHLLSAVFHRELGAATISFHLGEESSSIDLAAEGIETMLDAATIARIETIANETITEDRNISLRTVTRAEGESLLAAGKLRKLPPAKESHGGSIRMVEIAELDLNACGGTHLRSTGEIGSLLIRRVEKDRGGMRVEFLCGARAVAASRREFLQLTESAALLSSSFAQLAANIQKLLAEAKTSARERWTLLEQLAAYQAAELIQTPQKLAGFDWIVCELPQQDLEYAKLLASKISATVPDCIALIISLATEPAGVVFCRSAEITQPAAKSLNAGNVLRAALATLGLRGGGSATLAQSAVPQEQIGELRRLLEAAIGTAVGAES